MFTLSLTTLSAVRTLELHVHTTTIHLAIQTTIITSIIKLRYAGAGFPHHPPSAGRTSGHFRTSVIKVALGLDDVSFLELFTGSAPIARQSRAVFCVGPFYKKRWIMDVSKLIIRERIYM